MRISVKLLTVNLEIHGITRSKELINMLRKCGICISYNNPQLLFVTWALRDAESSKTCHSIRKASNSHSE